MAFSFTRLIAALLIFSSGVVSAIAQRPARPVPVSVEINGQVRYANNSAPADKVLVRLDFFSGGVAGQTLTDQTGKFNFTGLTPAVYVVTVRATGYAESRQQVDLQTTYREYLQFQLSPENPAPAQPTDLSIIVDARVPPEAQKEFDEGRAALLEEKKIEVGISHLEKAVNLYPNYLEARLLLGTAYMDARQFDKAERELRHSLKINPKLAAAYFGLGELYRRQQKNDEAANALQEGLKLEPKSHQGHFTLGQVYFAKGDVAKAGPEVGQALQLKPDYAEAYLLAGNLFLKARNAASALQMFEEYVRLEPKGQYAAQTREMVEKIRRAMDEKKQ
jgi:tetratricopeptide (TPR) repeat protein